MAHAGELLAGVAEIDITPPIGHRMAGHFYEVPSTSTHDPLKARALVLEQGNQIFAFAFCDVVSLSPNVTTAAREKFSSAYGVPVENTFAAATHSHTGALFDDIRHTYFHEKSLHENGEDPGAPIDYAAFLRQSIVSALAAAYESRLPASLGIVSAQQPGVAFNRRYRMKDGSVRFNPGQLNPDIVGPAGPTDPELLSLLIGDRADDQLRGGLTIFANHCDVIGGTEYSADYPFYIEQALREEFGRDFVSIFGQGTSGDVNHIDAGQDGPRKGVEISARIGNSIGATILNSEIIGLDEPSLAMRHKRLELPLQAFATDAVEIARSKLPLLSSRNTRFMELVEAIKTLDLAERGRKWLAEVQAFRLDASTAIIGLPGEIFAELGLAIKEQSPFPNTLIATLVNDRLGYVPTRKAFKEGSYEVTNARVQSGAGEVMADTAVNLLHQLAE